MKEMQINSMNISGLMGKPNQADDEKDGGLYRKFPKPKK